MEYGFYGRLKQEFPSQIIVDLNDMCNYECIHCPQSRMKKEGKLKGKKFSKEMNKKLVDEAANAGYGFIQQIRYTAAGEPFLHPEIMDILEYAICNSKTMVTITTNGSLMTEENMQKLHRMGLGLIDFSLDAYYDSTYSEIRRKGNLSVVRENVLRMLEIKKELKSQTRVVVSFVLQEKNVAEKEEFIRYWEEQGVDRVIIRQLHNAGGSMQNVEMEEKEGIYPCVYLWERLCLTPEGKISFCPADWEGNKEIGKNISQTTIKDAWRGEEYERMRREHLTNCFSADNACRLCKDRFITIWPDQGKCAYGDMIKEFSEKNS